MADPESSLPKAEAEVKKTEEEEVKTEGATATPLDPVVEEATETAKAVVEEEDVKLSSEPVEKEVEKLVVESDLPVSVGESSSEEVKASVSSQVQKVVDKLVSDSTASLKNLEAGAESWIKGTANKLTTSHTTVENTVSDETTRDRDIQPSATATATVTEERRASWTNCCGLFDLLAPNH